jgi:hypothetical protein
MKRSAWAKTTVTVIVHPIAAIDSVAINTPVWRADQEADPERQRGHLTKYAPRERLTVIRSVSESGSGQNGHRAQIMR